MKESVMKKLNREYKSVKSSKKGFCIKYKFQYNGCRVNFYYDVYDDDSASFILILTVSDIVYMTSLNIKKNRVKKYLNNAPGLILNRILDENGSLDDFYTNMELHIMRNDCINANYIKDYDYRKAVSMQRCGEEKIFFGI